MVISLEDLWFLNILAPKKPVAAEGSVDLELQHGEDEVLESAISCN